MGPRRRFGGVRTLKKAKISRNLHHFTRFAANPVTNTCTSTDNPFAAVFTFNDMSVPSDFTTLYDRYKITMVQARIQLVNNPDSYWGPNPSTYDQTTAGVQGRSNWFPKFWYCKDYDDGQTETVDQLRQRAGTKFFVLRPNKVYKINIRPAILAQTYQTSVSTGYAPKWNQWIDAGNTDVPHYGMKYNIDTLGLDPQNNYPFTVRIEYKFWFSMKDVR